jgi:hypothetical protein
MFFSIGGGTNDDSNCRVIEIAQICTEGQTTMRVTVGDDHMCLKQAYSEGFGG